MKKLILPLAIGLAGLALTAQTWKRPAGIGSSSPASGNCAQFDASGNLTDAGVLCPATITYWDNFRGASTTNNPFASSVNRIGVATLVGITNSIQFSGINYDIITADANTSDFYDIGIYGPCSLGQSNCPIVCDVGARNQTATGGFYQTCVQATPITIAPPAANQFYFVVYTGKATTAAYSSSSGVTIVPVGNQASSTTSTGGQLPSTIAVPSGFLPNSLFSGGVIPIISLH